MYERAWLITREREGLGGWLVGFVADVLSLLRGGSFFLHLFLFWLVLWLFSFSPCVLLHTILQALLIYSPYLPIRKKLSFEENNNTVCILGV